ncbi:tetratricopeptide repeat protein [Mucilaginibacter sp.]|uniref:tetratricopeptide repeat protein n=1 Tax=Mucilaginibacter sp. TaxID=1882438 RepID=UPI003264330F
MKIKFFMAGVLAFASATTFAQKKELSNAQSEFEKYQTIRQGQLAVTSLNNAKTSIDKAATDAKTGTLPQTYALKGAIYASLAILDTVTTTSAPLFATAEEALKKAKETDAKGENKKLIDDGGLSLAQYQLSAGVKAYQGAKYEVAYKAFDYYRSILPEDTTAIFYTGLAAYNSKNYPAAIKNYSKLVTTKYSNGERIYDELSGMYLVSKDTAGALKSLGEGLVKYPNSSTLRKKEIEIALQTGKSEEVLSKITAAIANDPKNKALYYYAGLVYSQTGDAAAAKVKTTKDAPGKAALKAKKTENYDKAAEMYKKALELDPNYFEANLNLGYILLAPAIESFNAANNLPGTASAQKQYDAFMAKSAVQFDVAKPFLQKAVDLKPGSRDALANLITYYRGKKDQPNVDKYTKLMDAAKE